MTMPIMNKNDQNYFISDLISKHKNKRTQEKRAIQRAVSSKQHVGEQKPVLDCFTQFYLLKSFILHVIRTRVF